MTMNDEFLKQNRPPIRAGFAEGLYRRIEIQEGEKPVVRRHVSGLVWKFALVAALGITLLFTLFTPTRAALVGLFEKIAGFNVIHEAFPTIPPDETPTIYEYSPQPLSTVLANLPFTFGMPAYIPEGYTLLVDVYVAQSKDWIDLTWFNQNAMQIHMFVQQGWDLTLYTGAGPTEEVQINGEPALLLRGGPSMNGSGQWDSNLNSASLYWRHNGLIYTFSFFDFPSNIDQEVSVQELIRMAASVP